LKEEHVNIEEKMTEDISVLKSVVKAHPNRLAALEKAQ
jgi:hypothetical protein